MTREQIIKLCQDVFPGWKHSTIDDFEFESPKGFSSFTVSVISKTGLNPPAIFYRRLEGKDNAILDYDSEKYVFLELADRGIAAQCYHYDSHCRLESFYSGHTLTVKELFEPDNLRQIADQLFQLHQIKPMGLPEKSLFEALHEKWGVLAQVVLEGNRNKFPANEQKMCDELREIYSGATLQKVKACLPEEPLSFCHNDTYHGNIMKLDDGSIKLLDFEFSCLNHKAYDFSNLFAETVMKHGLAEYPYFRIDEADYSDHDIALLINCYLDNQDFQLPEAREDEFLTLFANSKNMLMMSDYKYAMAALPLALEPIQKIRFIPYAYERYSKFLDAYGRRFGSDQIF